MNHIPKNTFTGSRTLGLGRRGGAFDEDMTDACMSAIDDAVANLRLLTEKRAAARAAEAAAFRAAATVDVARTDEVADTIEVQEEAVVAEAVAAPETDVPAEAEILPEATALIEHAEAKMPDAPTPVVIEATAEADIIAEPELPRTEASAIPMEAQSAPIEMAAAALDQPAIREEPATSSAASATEETTARRTPDTPEMPGTIPQEPTELKQSPTIPFGKTIEGDTGPLQENDRRLKTGGGGNGKDPDSGGG